jgi:hypothetical protein
LKIKRPLLLLLLPIMGIACNDFEWSLFSPTGINNGGALAAWRPCVVVHNPGGRNEQPFKVQFEAIDKLQRAGRLTWVRLGGLDLFGSGRDYVEAYKAKGLKVLGIISQDDLNSQMSWETAFDTIYRIYPGVDIWGISGEISNPAINILTMTAEEFMPKFKKLNLHVKRNYPTAQITSPPTIGSVGGPLEFEKFIELGLLDMDVIISLNIYSHDALRQYSAIFDRYSNQLINKRVWVTESGISNPENHIDWVNSFYPNISNTLRPEMICWYALWGGDPGSIDNSFGLITGVESGEYEETKLFKALTVGAR